MKPAALFLASGVLLSPLAVRAFPQAMVEYSLGAGRAAAAGSAAGKAGKSTGPVFDRTGKAINKAGKPATAASAKPAAVPARSRSARTAARKSAAAPRSFVRIPPPPPYIPPSASAGPSVDASQLHNGLERQELLSKIGKPSLKMTRMEGRDVVETFWYMGGGKETVVVTLKEGKVTSVSSAVN